MHVRSNLCYLIWLRHLLRTVTNRIFSPNKLIFLHACATCSELPSNISTMGKIKAGAKFGFELEIKFKRRGRPSTFKPTWLLCNMVSQSRVAQYILTIYHLPCFYGECPFIKIVLCKIPFREDDVKNDTHLIWFILT